MKVTLFSLIANDLKQPRTVEDGVDYAKVMYDSFFLSFFLSSFLLFFWKDNIVIVTETKDD